MRRIWKTLCLTAFAAVGVASLTACGGSGGGPVTQLPPGPSEPVDPPTPTYFAGHSAINGIDRIPQDMVKLTREQMQRRFVLGDINELHAFLVGRVACESYIQSGDCDNQAGKIFSLDGTVRTERGSSPFIKLVALPRGDDIAANILPVKREIATMPEVKIVTWTSGGDAASYHVSDSYLVVHSVGNGADNPSWYDDFATDKVKVATAIREDRLIYTAGWIRDDGNYIQHPHSYSCKGDDIQEGCIWTQFDFVYGGGTSYSAPQFAAALASVLAIAPDTTPQSLARFGKACVKKSGEGIEELLRVSGGLGVADFSCISNIITALANLPSGGTANVTVNGQPVTLSGTEMVLPYAEGFESVLAGTDNTVFFHVVPTGRESVLLVAGYRQDDLFAALSSGIRDDFFGFGREHPNVRETSVTAGHENLVFTLTEQRSKGGSVITGASGRSLTVTARETVALTEHTTLTATARADRFLGGEATIPLGTVNLTRGDWNPRFSLASETALAPGMSFRTKAEMTDPEDYTLEAGLRVTF